jgi:pimeloyl-ACP methyl ester carboxylesterase
VIHGDSDTLIDVSGGEATARAIPGAQLLTVEGMGHDLPPQLDDRLLGAILANVSAADGAMRGAGTAP